MIEINPVLTRVLLVVTMILKVSIISVVIKVRLKVQDDIPTRRKRYQKGTQKGIKELRPKGIARLFRLFGGTYGLNIRISIN